MNKACLNCPIDFNLCLIISGAVGYNTESIATHIIITRKSEKVPEKI